MIKNTMISGSVYDSIYEQTIVVGFRFLFCTQNGNFSSTSVAMCLSLNPIWNIWVDNVNQPWNNLSNKGHQQTAVWDVRRHHERETEVTLQTKRSDQTEAFDSQEAFYTCFTSGFLTNMYSWHDNHIKIKGNHRKHDMSPVKKTGLS